MFPSGPWQGYWEQPGWGRQFMRELVLRFAGGVVEGEGKDVVGAFSFRGEYGGAGAVRLVKQYAGRHQVLYEGVFDGEGTIFGRWSIAGFLTGPFALRPERFTVPEDAPILAVAAPEPRGQGGD